jgi:two-component system, OmpR family, sensor histidine kinase KdpD
MYSLASLPRLWQYLFAFLLISAITAVFVGLRDVLNTTLVALLYLIPLGWITAILGFGPGIASALVTFLTFNYYFIQPYYTFTVHQPLDIVILVVFLIVAVVTSQLVGRAQSGLAAATAREREATQLYELSTALTGMHDDQAIARILARQIHTVTECEQVELRLTGAHSFVYCLPERAVPERLPELTIPIQAARGTLGEMRIWRKGVGFSSGEERLLQTFASQGALALERAWLAEAEARARVLEESDQLKSAILSSVSHELRTPLSTIKAAASSLRGREVGWDSPARAELIAAIDDEADHLNMLVGNLLDMSRLESGALKPRQEWNILSEIIGSVLTRMKHRAEGHQIQLDIPEDLPLVPTDYVQIEQVFTNLVSNSFKYAPADTVVCIRARQEKDLIRIQVTNQGPHIPTDDLERIFDKFYRITAADRVAGTGLGLSICKGIVEAHGGQIWAENMPDGLAFNFTLPVALNGATAPSLPMDLDAE